MKSQTFINPLIEQKQPASNGRLLSLDALRGFDMFWIICGEEIFHGFAKVVKDKYQLQQSTVDWQIQTNDQLTFIERISVGISNQLHHVPWNGFQFYDLIFPLFIFIAGISMPFSFDRYLSNSRTEKPYKQIYFGLIKRTVLLILFGMVVNGALQFSGYENTRFASVLGRIGLACFFAALIYLNTNLRAQIVIFFVILLGYWFLLTQISVPGFGVNVLSPEGNLSAYLDREFLPGKLHRKIYDPEGLLSTFPAISTALLGVFTGKLLQSKVQLKPIVKFCAIIIASIILIILGLIWNLYLPINKNMWTSSFVLYAGGWSAMLFAIFYGIIDVAKLQKWCTPFVWIGTNSILIYMAAHGLINFEHSSRFILGGAIASIDPGYQHAFIWIGVLLIQLLVLRYLYKHKLFLKL